MNVDTLKLSAGQRYGLVLLRLLIGWHFLFEGILKLYNSSWTSKGYLLSATFMKPLFSWLANDSRIPIIDSINVVALIAVGVSLLIGIKIRWGCIAGMVLLTLYYLAHPPFPGLPQGPTEGSYWIVNKNLIEIIALYVIYQLAPGTSFGLESLFSKRSVSQA